ncbi:MAG: RAMP superfamily CRISPR-associated protein [Gallionella sp.]|jgi:CRISPR/Cas system CSM-associated protein Csm3 (group 7 of RAMP superfamily)
MTQNTRWIIEAVLKLATAMHAGTGMDVEVDEVWQTGLALDHKEKPYIPGASLKGALKALARRRGLDEACRNLFGDTTYAGQAEFLCASCCDESVKFAEQSRVAIDRVTGTAQDKKLFTTRLVPSGTQFKLRIVVQSASKEEIGYLLALLKAMATDVDFALGAHGNQGMGRVAIQAGISAKSFGRAEAKKWFDEIKAGNLARWEAYALPVVVETQQADVLTSMMLDLSLKFHTPFLVKQAGKSEENEADAVPRMNADGKVLLPASSLRGRLRSQAERILRTMGHDVPQGHAAPAWGGVHNDLSVLLFGTAGWRGIVRTNDCVSPQKVKPVRQEMVAIDRFTGGGKDGAKFNVDYVECPTLKGAISFDIARLKNARLKGALGEIDAFEPALGLITLLLRDLAEGDVSFGYGINKGYGQCREMQVLASWHVQLKKLLPDLMDPADHVLKSLRTCLGDPKAEPMSLGVTNVKSAEPFKLQPAKEGFYNPYHFIPLVRPDVSTWAALDDMAGKHGHHRYHGFSGRIACRLTTKTPMFIGAKRTKSLPAEVLPYEFKERCAIPGTSLRGLISSVHEALSNSPLRVLEDDSYRVYAEPRVKIDVPRSTADFIAAVSENLLPLGFAKKQKRKCIAPAELLFGVVEQASGKGTALTDAFAYAGNVCIGIGESRDKPEMLRPVRLKELSAPKPPSPSLYFYRQQEGKVTACSKRDLARRSDSCMINGRKVYLHAGNNPPLWASKSSPRGDERRVCITPIAKGQTFFFSVDFHNLTREGLASLCAAIYPSQEFNHKLGMGKPLGLGSVKIDPVGLFLVDRSARYLSDSSDSVRYHQAWISDDSNPKEQWADCLEMERQTPACEGVSPLDLAAEAMSKVDETVRRALLVLGNPESVTLPVHYPMVIGGQEEEKLYQWFVNNDKLAQERRQYLQPLTKDDVAIQPLNKNGVPNSGGANLHIKYGNNKPQRN